MMKLSTVTNMFVEREDGSAIPLEESMRRCREIGFTTLDISISNSMQQDHPLNSEDWENWVDKIGNDAAKLGVVFDTAHLPFFQFDSYRPGDAELEFLNRAKSRSIAACGMLGVKWAVDHITHVPADSGLAEVAKRKNMEYFAPYVEAAEKVGLGIAFENLFPSDNHRLCYPSAACELIDFIDSMGAKNIGICWDFGHGNLVYIEQVTPLRQVGNYLKATHVHDNWRKDDAHLTPFLGTVNWRAVMATLKEIGYEGNFTFELGNLNKGKPDAIQTMQAKQAYEVGQFLLGL